MCELWKQKFVDEKDASGEEKAETRKLTEKNGLYWNILTG
jgi:hypothetical protein